MLGTLHVTMGFIDTSNYRILVDSRAGDFAYWDTQCAGELILYDLVNHYWVLVSKTHPEALAQA